MADVAASSVVTAVAALADEADVGAGAAVGALWLRIIAKKSRAKLGVLSAFRC